MGLGDNQFSGTLWENFTANSVLRLMDLSGNEFVGTVPDTESLAALQELNIRNNKFTDLAPLGPVLVSFDGSNNRFATIPSTWKSIPVVMLDLSNNLLKWDGWLADTEVPAEAYVIAEDGDVQYVRYVKAAFVDRNGLKWTAEEYFANRDKTLPDWRGLSSLKLDDCKLGTTADAFLSSIAHLKSLQPPATNNPEPMSGIESFLAERKFE